MTNAFAPLSSAGIAAGGVLCTLGGLLLVMGSARRVRAAAHLTMPVSAARLEGSRGKEHDPGMSASASPLRVATVEPPETV
eukprot:1226044-Prymnesium_polylepis.1